MNPLEKIEKQIELIKSEENKAMGHVWNLENLEILMNGIDKRKANSKVNKAVLNYFVIRKYRDIETKAQILVDFTKTDAKRVNAILKAKTKKTHKKRILKLIGKKVNQVWEGLVMTMRENKDENLKVMFEYVGVKLKTV